MKSVHNQERIQFGLVFLSDLGLGFRALSTALALHKTQLIPKPFPMFLPSYFHRSCESIRGHRFRNPTPQSLWISKKLGNENCSETWISLVCLKQGVKELYPFPFSFAGEEPWPCKWRPCVLSTALETEMMDQEAGHMHLSVCEIKTIRSLPAGSFHSSSGSRVSAFAGDISVLAVSCLRLFVPACL